ncbi:MAG: hypothetical protein ACXAC5_03280 [Promethearchaeota archaeon]|jgi:hypothetical protein
MALIEVFHVVASQYPIDTNNATDIPQGRLVTLTAAGQVDLANVTTNTDAFPMGIAGDSRSTGTTSYTPESGSPLNQQQGLTKATDLSGALILGAYGDSQRFTQNRVADNYNEVLASGKMTVYHSGGEFWTDQYEVTADTGGGATTFLPAGPVYTSIGSTAANRGLFTDESTNENTVGTNYVVGLTVTSPTGYPSGVPGTGPSAVGFQALPEGGNSMSWGNFLHVKLIL